jgi:hypothetical protein
MARRRPSSPSLEAPPARWHAARRLHTEGRARAEAALLESRAGHHHGRQSDDAVAFGRDRKDQLALGVQRAPTQQDDGQNE